MSYPNFPIIKSQCSSICISWIWYILTNALLFQAQQCLLHVLNLDLKSVVSPYEFHIFLIFGIEFFWYWLIQHCSFSEISHIDQIKSYIRSLLCISLGPNNNRYQYGYRLLFIRLLGYRYLTKIDDYQCLLVGIKRFELDRVIGYFPQVLIRTDAGMDFVAAGRTGGAPQ